MKSHLRKDVFSSSFVIISDERGKRPNDYLNPKGTCPFCPGNERLTPKAVYTRENKEGWYIRVVKNKYPAITKGDLKPKKGFFSILPIKGFHEVIIEARDHSKFIYQINHLNEVLEVYAERMKELFRPLYVSYVLLFRNHGINSGASLRHPHSQLITLPFIPLRISDEVKRYNDYYNKYKRCIMCDTIKRESISKKRILYIDRHFCVFAPFASRFNFELWISPLEHQPNYYETKNFSELASVIKYTFEKIHNSITNPSYNIIFHTAPKGKKIFHWHIEILPKISMPAGFEWGSGLYINSISPEKAIAILKKNKRFI